jgi:hypothetical protein
MGPAKWPKEVTRRDGIHIMAVGRHKCFFDPSAYDIAVTPVLLAGSSDPFGAISGDKGFSLHGPFEWFRHGGIETGDETLDPPLAMVL